MNLKTRCLSVAAALAAAATLLASMATAYADSAPVGLNVSMSGAPRFLAATGQVLYRDDGAGNIDMYATLANSGLAAGTKVQLYVNGVAVGGALPIEPAASEFPSGTYLGIRSELPIASYTLPSGRLLQGAIVQWKTTAGQTIAVGGALVTDPATIVMPWDEPLVTIPYVPAP